MYSPSMDKSVEFVDVNTSNILRGTANDNCIEKKLWDKSFVVGTSRVK